MERGSAAPQPDGPVSPHLHPSLSAYMAANWSSLKAHPSWALPNATLPLEGRNVSASLSSTPAATAAAREVDEEVGSSLSGLRNRKGKGRLCVLKNSNTVTGAMNRGPY